MVSESFILFRAYNLVRTGTGGGVPGEDIRVHRVALGDLAGWLEERRAEGYAVDVKLLTLLGGAFACG